MSLATYGQLLSILVVLLAPLSALYGVRLLGKSGKLKVQEDADARLDQIRLETISAQDARISQLKDQCARLQEENDSLRTRLLVTEARLHVPSPPSAVHDHTSQGHAP